MWAKRSHQPRNNQHEIILVLQIQKRLEIVDRASTLRCGKLQHSSRAVKASSWIAADAPPVDRDFHHAPLRVCEIEEQATVPFGDPDMHGVLGPVVFRSRVENANSRRDRFGRRGFAHTPIVIVMQSLLERF